MSCATQILLFLKLLKTGEFKSFPVGNRIHRAAPRAFENRLAMSPVFKSAEYFSNEHVSFGQPAGQHPPLLKTCQGQSRRF
jgi:hypothetical protein